MSEAPWSTHVINDSNGNWQQLFCEITAQGLTEALSSAAGGKTLRSASYVSQRDVLLATDVVLIQNKLVGLNIIANRDRANPSQFFIEASLIFEKKSDDALYASLTLGGQEWQQPINSDGRVIFPSFPIESLIDFNSGQAITKLNLTITHS